MRSLQTFVPIFSVLVVLAGLFVSPSPAQAHRTFTMYEYFGAHPIPEELGTWCDQSDLHEHSYALNTEEYLVYEIEGVFHFVGDAYLHQGHSHHHYWYYDPHPISHISSHWCILEGPHSHWWQPRRTHHHDRVWISYDGYWTWEGAYSTAFWWTWSTWYDPFWRVHSHRVRSHRRYHPGQHYHQADRYRPRYDGRHRHIHHSDHRMQNARERHSRWHSTRQSDSRTNASYEKRSSEQRGEREHSGPSNLSDNPRGSSNPAAAKRPQGTAYRLPQGSDDEVLRTKPAKGATSSTKTRSKSSTKTTTKTRSNRPSKSKSGSSTTYTRSNNEEASSKKKTSSKKRTSSKKKDSEKR